MEFLIQEEDCIWEEDEEFEVMRHLICFWEHSYQRGPPENRTCGFAVKENAQNERRRFRTVKMGDWRCNCSES